MIYLKPNTETQRIYIPRNGVIDLKQNEFNKIQKLEDYLYEVYYNDINYSYAAEYFEHRAPVIGGLCSCIRVGDYVGRNLDWYDNYEAKFAVHTPASLNRFAVIGAAAGLPGLTVDVVESGAYTEDYKILPFYLQDGVNEKGLYCEMNVVPSWGQNQTIPVEEKTDRVCSIMLVRFILDKFDSVDAAIDYLTNHVEIFNPTGLISQGFELHYLLADAETTKVIEFVDNTIKVIDSNINTNFHLYDVDLSNTLYTPATAKIGLFPSTQGIEQYGNGLERYNALYEAEISERESMREAMNDVLYSKSYTLPADENFWYSEFVGGDITVDTPYDNTDFQARVAEYKEKWEEHTKDSGDCWITTHSSVYDIVAKKFWIAVQERATEHEISLAGTEYQKGFEDGQNAQKALITPITITANNIYSNENGFSPITVDVQPVLQTLDVTPWDMVTVFTPETGYDGISEITVHGDSLWSNGYNSGTEDARALMQELYATANGTYDYEYGYKKVIVDVPQGSEINNQNKSQLFSGNTTMDIIPDPGYTGLGLVHIEVDVPDRYWEGYNDGEAQQKSKLTSITATTNNTYTSEDGFSEVVVNVPTTGVNQDKNIRITANGYQTITFDEGYDGLGVVNITTNVPTSGDLNKAFVERSITTITADMLAGISYIGDHAFSHCGQLTNIVIPSGVAKLDISCFDSCINLSSVTIPEGVTWIDGYAFRNCYTLTNITLPASLELISNNGFESCSHLTSITCLATTAPNLGTNVFLFMPSSGTLYVPQGSDYSTWLAQLGSDWTIQYLD